jgi:phage gp36-like protein
VPTLTASNIDAPGDATGVTLTLYAPDETTVYALALTQNDDDTWSGTHTLASADVSQAGLYRYTIIAATPRGAIDIIAGDDALDEEILSEVAYEGRYTDSDSLELFIGADNASAFADGNGDGFADSGAVQQAIDSGEAEADSILNGGPYAVPLTFTGDVDPILRQHVNSLAAYWLNAKRPMTGQQQTGVSFATQRKNAMEWLRDVWYGDSTIGGATLATPAANAPIAIRPTVNADGQTVATVPAFPIGYWDDVGGYWKW